VWYRELRKVRITVSTGDRIVSDQVFEPAYETEEINGEGCGTCTGAAVSVNLS